MENNKFDVIILGGGPGGYTAALYCARAGLSTMVLEKMWPGGQMATTSRVDNYPGFEEGVDGIELSGKMQQSAERFGVVTQIGEVLSIDLESQPKVIRTGKGDLEAKAVILATGAAPRTLGIPGVDELRGRGMAYCATCDGMFYRNRTVVVVGGGNSAVADALFLAKICKKVYIVHRRDTLRASKTYMKTLEKTENIEFVWDSRVVEVLHDDLVTGVKVENVKTGDVTELSCEGVFVAVGRTPNTDMFKGVLDLDGQGYLIADETTRTNIPGVFAVGDVRTKPLRQIVTATADGAVASKYAEEYLAELCAGE